MSLWQHFSNTPRQILAPPCLQVQDRAARRAGRLLSQLCEHDPTGLQLPGAPLTAPLAAAGLHSRVLHRRRDAWGAGQ